ncbi:DNA polymerase III subunit theta [Klebsiella variicola]|uniref:DNA polymerase III subunit theta n=1 Tax=Klebsiella variicola TaxID=244366 RepID=UPI00396A1E85
MIPSTNRGFNVEWSIAVKLKDEPGKVNVALAAADIACKARLSMPVFAEVVMREQVGHLRDYFVERVRY